MAAKKCSEFTKKGFGQCNLPYSVFWFYAAHYYYSKPAFQGKIKLRKSLCRHKQIQASFNADSRMPMVHFLHVELAPEEKINYATETNQKDNEGNFVITNRRVIIQTNTDNTELPIETIDAIASTTSTVLSITAQEKKYYIFMPENQMKYAIAVLKWTAKK